MTQLTNKQACDWWQAVRSIAALVNTGGLHPGEDGAIRASLVEQGFSADGIGKALDWMDRALLSGSLHDSLGMLHVESSQPRVEHPLETASIHPLLLRAVESGRRRGLFPNDMAERLLEGLRAVDTRDWDIDEAEDLLVELICAMSPTLADQDVIALLFGPELYH